MAASSDDAKRRSGAPAFPQRGRSHGRVKGSLARAPICCNPVVMASARSEIAPRQPDEKRRTSTFASPSIMAATSKLRENVSSNSGI